MGDSPGSGDRFSGRPADWLEGFSLIGLIWTSRSLSVTASFALVDVIADEPLALDWR